MKYIKNFESKTAITKYDKKLIDAVIDNDLNKVKKYLSLGANTNIKMNHYTAPMWCILNYGDIPRYAEPEEKINWEKNQEFILTELLNSNPDLYVKSDGLTFWDMLNQYAYDFIKNNFIEKFQEYEMRISANKYNL